MAGTSLGSRVRYLLIIWIFVISGVAYLDRTNISIAGIELAKDFAIDKIRLGWVFSAFLLGYAGFQVPAGWLVGRYGPRKTLMWGMMWWGALSVCTTIVPPTIAGALWLLILVRFVLGMGEAVMYPAANQFISNWFPSDERGKANGWVFGGVGMGAGLTPPIVTALMLAYGWRMPFYFAAVVGVIVGVVWYIAARDKPEEHPSVSSGELAHIQAGRPPHKSAEHSPVPWGKLFGSRDVWMLSAAYFTYGYVAFIFLTWFFIYLADGRGLNLKSSAVYSMLPFVAMTAGSLLGGVVSDWLVRKKGQYAGRSMYGAATLFLSALFLVIGSHAQDTLTAVLALAGGAGALYFGQACYFAVAADFGGPHTGVVSGMMNMGAQIAGAITASLTPFIAAEYGWQAAFYVAAALVFLGGFFWLWVNPNKRIEDVGIGGPGALVED
jgi:ACS family glucarate transporter-like MFS transporter